MKILAVGGGSGGHITPIVAVIKALQAKDNSVEIEVWTDSGFITQARQKIEMIDTPILVRSITSGKLRRYNSIPLWQQLLRFKSIVLPNIIDSIKLSVGFIQSMYRLTQSRPDIIFCKGGFVCLPVGFAARVLSIPVLLHDSDAHPGLTNRILARSARKIATGAPLEHYSYPQDKAVYIGIPIDKEYKKPTSDQVDAYKKDIGFDTKHPLVVVTGGGLGSKHMNDATIAVLDELLTFCNVLLICGHANYESLRHTELQRDHNKYKLLPFVTDKMVETLAAADIVVARAGATTLLELSALAKPTIIIPNPYLTGGHQLKNAEVYAKKDAAIIVAEEELNSAPKSLLDAINAIIHDTATLNQMSKAIHAFSKPNAADDMATLILDEYNKA